MHPLTRTIAGLLLAGAMASTSALSVAQADGNSIPSAGMQSIPSAGMQSIPTGSSQSLPSSQPQSLPSSQPQSLPSANTNQPIAPSQPQPLPAAPCKFVLGFATIAGLIPDQVGGCTDNQASGSNGDAIQHTTKGLLVWRKADNWTAFTDGYHTWVNGPYGVQERLNTQRFAWEANPDGLPTAPDPVVTPPPAPQPAPQPGKVPFSNDPHACEIYHTCIPGFSGPTQNLMPKGDPFSPDW
jgi:hypothetical protein